MTSACSHNGALKRISCHVCGELGKSVQLFTVRSLIKEQFLEAVGEAEYFFCSNPNCGVVYYSFAKEVIRKHQIKTRVGLKEKEAPRSVCYCFGYTIENIHDEIRETGRSTVEKEISNKIQSGLCHCEDANPEGRCCLGNVSIAVKEAFSSAKKNDSQRDSVEMLYNCCKSQQ